jgi:2-dehydropantoate 2-reductase
MTQGVNLSAFDILGSGALGCSVASLLKLSGHEVRLVSEARTAGQIDIELTDSVLGRTFPKCSVPILARSHWTPERGRSVIIASKAQRSHSLLKELISRSSDGATLPQSWLICNGLGLLDSVPLSPFPIGSGRAVCGFGVQEESAGRFVRSGPGQVDWAPLRAPAPLDSVPQVFDSVPTWLESLAQTGTRVRRFESPEWIEWRKVAWNASMNPVLALTGQKNGALFEQPALMTRFGKLLDEVVRVARASGIEIDPDGTLKEEILTSVRGTAQNLNSMAVDVLRPRGARSTVDVLRPHTLGPATEIDWINGAVLRKAKALGVSAPENEKIIYEIKSLSH